MAFGLTITALQEFLEVVILDTDEGSVLSKLAAALDLLALFKPNARNVQLFIAAGIRVDHSFENLFVCLGTTTFETIWQLYRLSQACDQTPKTG